jgi:hypothetical protein
MTQTRTTEHWGELPACRHSSEQARPLLTPRLIRRRELMSYSGLRLACLIIDYGVMLDEVSEPIEVILDFEFGLQTAVNTHKINLGHRKRS